MVLKSKSTILFIRTSFILNSAMNRSTLALKKRKYNITLFILVYKYNLLITKNSY